MKRSPALAVAAFLGVSVMATVSGVFGDPASPSPQPTGTAVGPSATAASSTPTDAPTGTPAPTAGTSAPTGSPPPAPSPDGSVVEVAVVPVTHFRSTRTTTGSQEVADVLAGTSKRYEALELVADEADAILAALGQARPSDPARLILADTAEELTSDLAMNRKRLAFLRADAVTPAVRSLGWGSRALFGVGRLTDLSEWRLSAALPEAPAGRAFDAGATWTLFAGGDILLDRGVYETIRVKDKGVDFPFDGGTAEITSRYCCSSFGWELPRTKRTGNAGAMRALISGADLAIANFENPAPDRFRWHTKDTVFTADPGIIDGLVTAGIDYVGLANNHIGDAGRAGIAQTIRNLEKRGLAYSGAGENEAAARRPAMLEVNGTTVAILAYDRIAKYYFADADTAGSAPLSEGITLELTFHGGTLAQVRIRPHIVLDKAQPNFLDPAGDGRVVMSQVFGGPPGMLPG